MADLTEIRVALAACFSSLESEVQVSAYMLDAPTPPAIFIYPSEIDYDLTAQRGFDQWTLTIQAVVQHSLDKAGQVNLDAFLAPSGPRSVKALVEADRQLGGTVDSVRVVSCSGYRKYLSEGQNPILLGAEWSVEVLATGN